MSREEEMRELLARFESSGKSLLQFGKDEGVAYTKLQYWRRRFRGKKRARRSSPGFARVHVVESDGPVPLVIRLKSGISIEVDTGFRDEDLVRLVRALESC